MLGNSLARLKQNPFHHMATGTRHLTVWVARLILFKNLFLDCLCSAVYFFQPSYFLFAKGFQYRKYLQSLTKINGQKCNFFLFNSHSLPYQCFSDKICCAYFVFSSTLILGEREEVNLSEYMLEIPP